MFSPNTNTATCEQNGSDDDGQRLMTHEEDSARLSQFAIHRDAKTPDGNHRSGLAFFVNTQRLKSQLVSNKNAAEQSTQ